MNTAEILKRNFAIYRDAVTQSRPTPPQAFLACLRNTTFRAFRRRRFGRVCPIRCKSKVLP